jgi:DNA polymerase-3 subunit gamma/tau
VAYLALARKYRPQRFADMIGQEHVTRTLANAIKSDRVHHAYLFCGVRGLGKTTAARILAKCLVCEHGPTPEPCNACGQCRGVNEGHSVDVIEIDGASNNSVENIRSLREQVAYLPQFARRKIYIIDEVHMLTQQAFNALLKTLEEPPAHVTFLFATTDPHKVLPTILSRVSRLDYRRVRASTLVPYLQEILRAEGFAVEEEGLYVIARCGEGSVRDSLTLLDKVIAFAADPQAITTAEVLEVLGQASRFTVAALVQAIIDRDAAGMLRQFESITESGSDLKQLALAILQHLRDLTVVKLAGSRDALLDMSDDLHDQLVAQAGQVESTVVAQWFDRFARVFDSLENSRVPKLVIEMALLELVDSEPLLPLGDLIARLDALAGGRAMPGGGGGASGRGAPSRGGARSAGPTTPSRMAAPAPASMPAPAPVPTPEPRPAAAASPAVGSPYDKFLGEFLDASANRAPAREPASAYRQPEPARSEPAKAEPPKVEPPKVEPPKPAPPKPELALVPPPAPEPQLERQGFALSNETLASVEPRRDPEAGCPSSRCVPREAIAWQTMAAWDAWEIFLQRARDEDPMLGSLLSQVGLIGIESGVVRIAAPASGFAQIQLRENPELKVVFERLTADYFGEPMRLDIHDAAPSLPDQPSLELVEHERERRHVEAIEHDARAHPRIRALLHAFGGRVERIEPLVGPQLPPLGQRGLPP